MSHAQTNSLPMPRVRPRIFAMVATGALVSQRLKLGQD
jgi:hypothetical protein